MPKEKFGEAEVIIPDSEQKLNEEDKKLLQEAYNRLEMWQKDCSEYHETASRCRKVFRLDDPEQDPAGTPAIQKTLQLQTLKSTINNSVADQIDNTPDAMCLPETPEAQAVADEMTDVVKFILNNNSYEVFHRKRVHDFFVAGTSVTQIGWDETMDNGKGNISIMNVPIENMIWDPLAPNIQDGRAVIKITWHPLAWFADHYPDAAPFIIDESNKHGNVGLPETAQSLLTNDEGKAMLMEYWFRRFDAKTKRYTINCALFAGGALLDKFENAYAHGRYPFVFDAFTQIPGQPVGESMVYELTPMMRYINRYAHYIDENLRYSCKARMLVRKGSGINEKDLADWTKNIVEGDTVSEEDVRWFDIKPLSNMVSQQIYQFQSDMKMDSGQNQFARGETAGGVTAASAIASLQEAGGKISRMRTGQLSAGFKEIVEQILWLVAEFYDEDRQTMIVGENLVPKSLDMSAKHLMPNPKDGHFPPPPYSVQVVVQRRNPLRVQAQNELMMQAYSMSAQGGNIFPLSLLFQMMNVDGKDKILPAIKAVETFNQKMQELAQQNQQLSAENANMKEALTGMADQMQPDTAMPVEPGLGEDTGKNVFA